MKLKLNQISTLAYPYALATAGLIATRDSWTLISLGTPTIIYLPFATTAAFINPTKSGCGLVGRERSSG